MRVTVLDLAGGLMQVNRVGRGGTLSTLRRSDLARHDPHAIANSCGRVDDDRDVRVAQNAFFEWPAIT